MKSHNYNYKEKAVTIECVDNGYILSICELGNHKKFICIDFVSAVNQLALEMGVKDIKENINLHFHDV